jgi:hypothetical protein
MLVRRADYAAEEGVAEDSGRYLKADPGDPCRAEGEVMADGIGLDACWDELDYRQALRGSLTDQGAFILRKLSQHDLVRFKTVMDDLYRHRPPDPSDITKFEWQVILAYLGATDEEIREVQHRMGRAWR